VLRAAYSAIREAREVARCNGSTVALVLAPDWYVSHGAPIARRAHHTKRRLGGFLIR
jgi:hypothetical protein